MMKDADDPENEPTTTAGVIALGNLDVRIDGQAWLATRGRLTVGERAELVELIALRGHVLGRIADAERALALAEQFVCQVPNDARSFVARARMAAIFHRFALALTDLDTAAALGRSYDSGRGALRIYQALGRYDEALTIRRQAYATGYTPPVTMIGSENRKILPIKGCSGRRSSSLPGCVNPPWRGLDRSAGGIAMTLIAVIHPPIMRKYTRGVEVCCCNGIFCSRHFHSRILACLAGFIQSRQEKFLF